MIENFRERCTIVAYTAGGVLIAGRKRFGYAVINDGQLILSDDAGSTIDTAPVSSVEVDTAVVQRVLGAATLLRMSGNRWAVDFARAAVDQLGTIKGLRLARRKNERFRQMLLELGAVDRRSRPRPE